MVSIDPVSALTGVKDVTTGGGMYVKPANEAVPPGVVTDTFPEVPAPTTALKDVDDIVAKDVACTPPKLTAFTSL